MEPTHRPHPELALRGSEAPVEGRTPSIQRDRSLAERRWVSAAAMMAMFMAAVESTIVSTAMPTIVATLGDFHLLSWIFAIYLLTQAVVTPIYGRFADLYGRKGMLLTACGIFLAGSALCGIAWNMPALIGFRALQGLGAGGIMPIATTLMGDLYPAEERGRMQGYISSLWGVSAVTGPLLGAFLVEHVGWQTVFWVNLPIGVVAIVIVAVALREDLPPRPHSIDYWGSALMMIASSALILALVQASSLGWRRVAALFAASGLAVAALILHERRHAEPMMPLALWRERIIVAVNLNALVIGAAMMAAIVFVPTYVQGVMGRSPVVAGFALTALSLGWPFGSTLAGRLVNRSSYRAMAAASGALLVAGAAMLVTLEPARGPAWAGGAAFLIGLGMGFGNTGFLLAAQSSVDWRRRGLATSTSLFMRMLGQSVGAAIFGGILNAGLARRLPGTSDAVERLMHPAERANLGAAAIERLAAAVAASLHEVFLAAGVLALLALAVALLFPAGVNPRRGVAR